VSDECIQIFGCEQGSAEWHRLRLGLPTASEFSAVLAKGEGKTRRSYMMRLIGEILTGLPADTYTNGHMERGKEMEAEARDLYAFRTDADLKLVGFIKRDEIAGCSPDALIAEDGVLEIKTKLPHLQAEVLLADRLPPEHVAQCQGVLWVSGRKWLDFVSYWPGMPMFVKRVERDPVYHERLSAEVSLFMRELATYLEHLRSLS
jgi:YqaJ-like viral recombinase domain